LATNTLILADLFW